MYYFSFFDRFFLFQKREEQGTRRAKKLQTRRRIDSQCCRFFEQDRTKAERNQNAKVVRASIYRGRFRPKNKEVCGRINNFVLLSKNKRWEREKVSVA